MSAEKVLCVTGDDALHQAVARALASDGFEVVRASAPGEALERLADHALDLLVVDLDGLGTDAFEFLDTLRARVPDALVIGIANRPRPGTYRLANRAGVYHTLAKPLDQTRVRKVMARARAARRAHRDGRSLVLDPEATPRLIGRTPPMRELYRQIALYAENDVTVLIHGETGTGKELVARTIHWESQRSNEGFLALNMGAISPTLLESELFGHVRGSFTGAGRDHIGYFERAGRGTLFLDEIGEASHDLQVKLLRVLQERRFERLGDEKTRTLEARVLAATNRDPRGMLEDGTLRRDLYYRLTAARIPVPPLRERKDDLELLVPHLLARAVREQGIREPSRFSDDAWQAISEYPWPGNVRELKNCLARAASLANGGPILGWHLELGPLPVAAPRAAPPGATEERSLAAPLPHDLARSRHGTPLPPPWRKPDGTIMTTGELQRAHVEAVLRSTGGNVSRAARLLRMPRTTLQYKLKGWAESDQGGQPGEPSPSRPLTRRGGPDFGSGC